MLKKSLILLTTTAILLPMEAVSAASDERKYREQDRAKQERVERSRAERSRVRQERPKRAERSEPRRQRAQSRPAPRREAAPRARSGERQMRAREAAMQDRSSNQSRQRVRSTNRTERTVQHAQPQTRARDSAIGNRSNARSVERVNVERNRSQTSNSERRVIRNVEQRRAISEARKEAFVRRDANGKRYSSYKGARVNQDSRRVVRGSSEDRGRPVSRTRRLDYERDHAYRGNDNWDRGRVRDRRRGNYRRDWWYRDRWHRDVDIFFGFSPYYSGFGFNVGYHRGYYNGYYNGHYYGRNYYFGHWPLTSGYYHTRSHWFWNHHHHHYHYGDYCPHSHSNVHVTYSGDYDSGHHSSSSSGDQVAGMLLGGIVGGIIGAEIDGGRDKTAGAVIGSVVGAAIGASASKSSEAVHYPEAGVVYDTGGRHQYETETYVPPREIKTCMRYEKRGGDYVCTKWTIEYDYED